MGFCYKTASIWQVIGYVFLVLKILIPVVIIILGIVNLAKAVISNDEKAISKTTMSLMVLGLFIFFIPLIVTSIFNLLGLFVQYSDDFKNCLNCVTSPRKRCDTSYHGNVIPID